MIKDKQTTRLFYGKWLYKVSLRLLGAGVLRRENFESFDAESFYDPYGTNIFKKEAINNKENILKVGFFLNDLTADQYAIRIESSILDFYTNDQNLFAEFKENFEKLIRFSFSPSEDTVDLLSSNEKVIIAKKYPHNKYQYRVYLRPHLVKDTDKKYNFLQWLENQNDKVTCTESLKEWFIKTKWNWERRYVLVDDSKTLLMLKLHSPDAVGTVYKYVISDK